MPTTQVLVRNIDPNVVDQLKERAKGNGHSLQVELRLILINAAKMRRSALLAQIEYAEKIFGDQEFPDSVKLIREDRDR